MSARRGVSRRQAASRALSVCWREADHTFANPAGSAYDAEAAALAWDRTTCFPDQALKARG